MSTTTDITPRPVDTFFPSHAVLRRSGLCPNCGEAVDPSEFLDDVSRAEFAITGMCSGCQTVIYQHLADMEDD